MKLKKFLLLKNYFLVIFLFTVWIFKTYNGNYHSEYSIYSVHLFGKYEFFADPFIKDGDIPGLLVAYKILKYFKIDPNNDLTFFFFHFFLQCISVFIYFKIIQKFIIKDLKKTIIILLSLIPIGKITAITYPSILSQLPPGSMTYFAHIFFPIFLYSLLKRKIFFLILSSSLMLFFHPRVGWMPVLIGTIYSLIFWDKNKTKIWFFFPFVISLYYYFVSEGGIKTLEEKIFLIKNYFIFREDVEVTFTLYDKKKIIFQVLSFFLYFFFLKKIKNIEFKRLSIIVLLISLFIFIFEWIYTSTLVEIIPIPQIYALSPPRSFFVYELFFFILFFNFIFYLKIKVCFQVILIAFFFFAKLSFIGLAYSVLVCFSFLLIILFFEKKLEFHRNILLLFCLIILPGSLYLVSKKIINFDYYSFSKINRWTINSIYPTDKNFNFSRNENRKLFDFLLSLRKCNDFILFDPIRYAQVNNIAYKSRITLEVNKSLFGKNFSIEKTKFYSDTYYFGNVISNKFKKLENFTALDLEKFEKLNIVLLIPKDKERLILEKYPRYNIDENNYLIFFEKNSNLEKYCKI